jgi:tetratricopeptide (TPR) repeat protein
MTDRLRAGILALRGDWPGSLAARKAFLEALQPLGEVPALRMHALYLTWPLIFMGRLREAQRSVEEALAIADQLDEREVRIAMLEALGLTTGLQERYPEADERFTEALNFHANYYANRDAGDPTDPDRYIRATLGFRALVELRQGRLAAARNDLERALQVKTAVGDRMGMPEVHVWLGQVAELEGSAAVAEQAYRNALVDDAVGRSYFTCAALTGLARVTADQGRHDECADAMARALEISMRYDYNDLAASLLLTRGRLAWEGAARGAIPKRAQQDARDAMVHALRFNRFLLDEVLVGRAGGTVFRPLVADWAERGPAGRRALAALRTWWATGQNQLDAEPPGMVSTLEPGIQLVDGERLSRQNEPGTGEQQRTVLEHLDAALS